MTDETAISQSTLPVLDQDRITMSSLLPVESKSASLPSTSEKQRSMLPHRDSSKSSAKRSHERKNSHLYYHFPQRMRFSQEEFRRANKTIADTTYRGMCPPNLCRKFIGTKEVPFENIPCI